MFYFTNRRIFGRPLVDGHQRIFPPFLIANSLSALVLSMALEQVPRHRMLGHRLNNESVLKILVLESDGLSANPRTGIL